MRRAALLCFSVVTVYSGAPANDDSLVPPDDCNQTSGRLLCCATTSDVNLNDSKFSWSPSDDPLPDLPADFEGPLLEELDVTYDGEARTALAVYRDGGVIKIEISDDAEIDAAGDSGNCGFACLDPVGGVTKLGDLFFVDEDGGGCLPKKCSQDDIDVANAEAVPDVLKVEGDCPWICLDGYQKNDSETACNAIPCATDVENATATGGFIKDNNCDFQCASKWEKSDDGLSCVPKYCPQSGAPANAEATGLLTDPSCGFECEEGYVRSGSGCQAKPCTTTVANAIATGTDEGVGDCSYVCAEGYAKHKTNGICEELSDLEKQSVEEGDLDTTPGGGKMGAATGEPAEESSAAKMITSLVWLALLGAPFWQ